MLELFEEGKREYAPNVTLSKSTVPLLTNYYELIGDARMRKFWLKVLNDRKWCQHLVGDRKFVRKFLYTCEPIELQIGQLQRAINIYQI